MELNQKDKMFTTISDLFINPSKQMVNGQYDDSNINNFVEKILNNIKQHKKVILNFQIIL